jgi:O-6-methylguanine DNA methyltransferase
MVNVSKSLWMAELNDTQLGEIWIARNEKGLVALDLWGDQERFANLVMRLTGEEATYTPEKLFSVIKHLSEYLSGKRKRFEELVDWSIMTPFQQEVLHIVQDIEFGRTRTYGEIANELGKPQAVRAVGGANATNPIPIIIPCHRVLGSDGRLRGYGAPGGVETKAWLLTLEGSWLI